MGRPTVLRTNIFVQPNTVTGSGTNLVTLTVNHMKYVNECSGYIYPSSKNGILYEPIVFIPRKGYRGLVKIPHGCVALHARFGKLMEEPLSAGLHFLGPGHHVQYLVTKHAFVFDTPVSNVLTADNVPVAIDCQLLCRIDNALLFILSIGAEKLDQWLRAAQDEALRQLARQTKACEVRDLQGIETTDILNQLADKFDDYGVEVINLNITSVRIQEDLAHTLQLRSATLTFKSLETRQQEQKIVDITNRENLALARKRLENARREKDTDVGRRVAEAHKLVAQVIADTEKKVASIQAECDAQIREIQTTADLRVANINAEGDIEVTRIDAEGEKEVAELQAKAEAFREKAKAAVARIVKEAEAERVRILGEAEQEFAKSLQARRDFSLDVERAAIFEEIMSSGGVEVCSGIDYTIPASAKIPTLGTPQLSTGATIALAQQGRTQNQTASPCAPSASMKATASPGSALNNFANF